MSEIYIKYDRDISEVKDILQKALEKVDNKGTQEFRDKYLKFVKSDLDKIVKNTFNNMISEIEIILRAGDDLGDR